MGAGAVQGPGDLHALSGVLFAALAEQIEARQAERAEPEPG